MIDRKAALHHIDVGDIFHAEGSNGASLICLTLSVTDATIQARTVTTQYPVEFDRETGIAEWGSGQAVIDCTDVLPEDIFRIMMQIDRKYGSELDLDNSKLTDDEKRALIFIADNFPKKTTAE